MKVETPIKEVSDNNRLKARVAEKLREAGMKELPEDEVLERRALLETSSFGEDSEIISRGMPRIFEYLKLHHPQLCPPQEFTEERKIDGEVAAQLHDIGKVGPPDATMEEQQAILDLYSIRNVDPSGKELVVEIVKRMPEAAAGRVLDVLSRHGGYEGMTMRNFWDKHGEWTLEMLDRYPRGINSHVREITALHHADRGINVKKFPGIRVSLESRTIGLFEEYVDAFQREALMVLDKYQAQVYRSGVAHEAAMDWLKAFFHKPKGQQQLGIEPDGEKKEGPGFENDPILDIILEAIDDLGKQGEIFKEI